MLVIWLWCGSKQLLQIFIKFICLLTVSLRLIQLTIVYITSLEPEGPVAPLLNHDPVTPSDPTFFKFKNVYIFIHQINETTFITNLNKQDLQ